MSKKFYNTKTVEDPITMSFNAYALFQNISSLLFNLRRTDHPTMSLSWLANINRISDAPIKLQHRKIRNIMERSDCFVSNYLRKLYSSIGLMKSMIF